MLIRHAVVLALALLGAAAGCGENGSSFDREERSVRAIEECRGHGGVAAFEDDSVICADQTTNDERGAAAVEACRGRGGVSAFDDDIVICRDESAHEAPEG